MFEIGDVVRFKKDEINSIVSIDMTIPYTIADIKSEGRFFTDIYLKEHIGLPWYHLRFEIDIEYNRKRKILKLKTKIKNYENRRCNKYN